MLTFCFFAERYFKFGGKFGCNFGHDGFKVKWSSASCHNRWREPPNAPALTIYKNPSFDPSHPLTITFDKQPAVDTGGPKREFYTQLLYSIATSDGSILPVMFEGEEGRLLPSYNSSVIYSGMMRVVGKITAHSMWCGISILVTGVLLVFGHWWCLQSHQLLQHIRCMGHRVCWTDPQG